MVESLRRLVELNDQNSLFAEFREYSPKWQFQVWQAKRFLLTVTSPDFSALDKMIKKQVEEHRKSASNTHWKPGCGDILDLVLNDTEYGKKASTLEIIDQMKSFFFAGNDTISAVLS